MTSNRELQRKRGRILPRMKPEEVTVELWLSAYRELFPDKRNPATRRHDEQMLGPFVREYGRRKMHEISALEAQAWTMRHPDQVRWLRHAWGKATAMGVVPLNIWRFVELPIRVGHEPVRAPTADEFEAIQRELRRLCLTVDTWWWTFRAMVLVAAYTGARQGGLIRLERRDVDLAARRMRVTEKGGLTRTIAIPAPAFEPLQAEMGRRPWVEHRRDTIGRARPVTQITARKLVFTRKDGAGLSGQAVQRRWQTVRGEFPHGFHSLKHHAATWLAAQGVDELAIAVQLGHFDKAGRPYADLVRRVYDHPDPEPLLAQVGAL